MLMFTHEEVEEMLANTLGDVTRKDIAKACQLSESYIKRQFNGNDEQMSCLFRALQIICGIYDTNEETGDKFYSAFKNLVEMSKPRKVNKTQGVFDCLIEKHHLDGGFGAEILEALKDKQLDRREIRRLMPFISSLRDVLDALDDSLNAELKEDIKGDVFVGLHGHAN
jgi:hypothetical protein